MFLDILDKVIYQILLVILSHQVFYKMILRLLNNGVTSAEALFMIEIIQAIQIKQFAIGKLKTPRMVVLMMSPIIVAVQTCLLVAQALGAILEITILAEIMPGDIIVKEIQILTW